MCLLLPSVSCLFSSRLFLGDEIKVIPLPHSISNIVESINVWISASNDFDVGAREPYIIDQVDSIPLYGKFTFLTRTKAPGRFYITTSKRLPAIYIDALY